jgi:hypothetical protein
MEEAITGDFSLVKAWKGDTDGNLVFKVSTAAATLIRLRLILIVYTLLFLFLF